MTTDHLRLLCCALNPHSWKAAESFCGIIYYGWRGTGGRAGTIPMNNYRKRKQRKVDPLVLADIVDRIVRLAKPQKIILFGSSARDQMRPNSDVDLLVVKSGRFNRGRLVEKKSTW